GRGGRGGGGRGRRGGNAASAPATAEAAATPPAEAANYMVHWSVVNSDGAAGTISMDANDPVNTTALAHSMKLDITQLGGGQRVGPANEEYCETPVKPNTE